VKRSVVRFVIESVKAPPTTPEARMSLYEHAPVIDTLHVSNQLHDLCCSADVLRTNRTASGQWERSA